MRSSGVPSPPAPPPPFTAAFLLPTITRRVCLRLPTGRRSRGESSFGDSVGEGGGVAGVPAAHLTSELEPPDPNANLPPQYTH